MAKFPCLFLVLFYPTIHCVFMHFHKSILEQGTVPTISEYLLVLCCQHEPFTLGWKRMANHLTTVLTRHYFTKQFKISHTEMKSTLWEHSLQHRAAQPLGNKHLTSETQSRKSLHTVYWALNVTKYKRLSKIQILKYIHNCFLCNEPPRMQSTLTTGIVACAPGEVIHCTRPYITTSGEWLCMNVLFLPDLSV